MNIPVRNLYYLFAYAWSLFPEGHVTEVGVEDCPDVKSLFAKLLVSGANRLLRRGLDRGYRTTVESTRAPRGRILMDEVIKAQTVRRGEVVCAFDELTPNVLHNQILKATAASLARAEGMANHLRRDLGLLTRRMDQVADVRLTSDAFARVQLARNTGQYLPLLRLCELVHRSLLPDEHGRSTRFVEILEDEASMSKVFESFLRNFYAHEQGRFRVGSEIMRWSGESAEKAHWDLIPAMKTDVTLRSPSRVIIMDAKFYKSPIGRNEHGELKHHADNLYQLYTYLRHAQDHDPSSLVEGALIYASSGEPFDMQYRLREHQVRIVALDLNRPWPKIHEQLLAFVDAPTLSAA
jgi:5-methylcytosine-specific restriction enzyme subunit McrC